MKNETSVSVKIEKFKSKVDYTKESKDQLTLNINDELVLVNRQYQDWWLMKNLSNNQIGFVEVVNIESLDELSDRPYTYHIYQ